MTNGSPSPWTSQKVDAARPLDRLNDKNDTLGHRAIAADLVSTLGAGFQPDGSRVYGLSGPWGSGKTSVVNEVAARLQPWERDPRMSAWQEDGERRKGPVVLLLNPWEFEQGASLSEELLIRLHRSMKFGRSICARTKVSLALAKLRLKQNRDVGLTVAGAVAAGVFAIIRYGLASPWPREGKWLAIVLVVSIAFLVLAVIFIFRVFVTAQAAFDAAMRVTRDEQLGSRPVKALVIVDDIDRLPAERVLEMLRVIKNVGDIPYVNYLLVYDRAQLARIEAPGGTRLVDWMDKFVTDEWALPAVSRRRMRELLASGIREIFRCTDEDSHRVARHFVRRIASDGLSVRATGALVQGARRSYRETCEDVEPIDALCLEFIRQQAPEHFARLVHAVFLKPVFRVSQSKHEDRWRELRPSLSEGNDRVSPGLRAALATLISTDADVLLDRQHGALTPYQAARSPRRRFGDPVYFLHTTDELDLSAMDVRALSRAATATDVAQVLGQIRVDRLGNALVYLLEEGMARMQTADWPNAVVDGALQFLRSTDDRLHEFASILVQAPGRVRIEPGAWLGFIDATMDNPYLAATVVAWLERHLPDRAAAPRPARVALSDFLGDRITEFDALVERIVEEVYCGDLTPLQYVERRLFWCLPDGLQGRVFDMARPTPGWMELLMWSTNGERESERTRRAERAVRQLRKQSAELRDVWMQVRGRHVTAHGNTEYGAIVDAWFVDDAEQAPDEVEAERTTQR